MIVVLQIDSTVAIRQQGVGAALPETANLVEQQISSNPPEVPATIRVLGGPNRYQARLRLEAVGYDTDGRIRGIDQLSYKPFGGWGKQTMFFTSVDGSARTLALRDVYKLYRIADIDSAVSQPIVTLPDTAGSIQQPFIPIGPIQGGGVGPAQQNVGGAGQYVVQRIREILPLQKGLVQTGPDANGVRRRLPEVVYGTYYMGNTGLENPRNSGKNEFPKSWQYRQQFNVDHEQGLVRFDEQVVRWDDAAKEWKPADLFLECSFFIRNTDTNAQLRWGYSQQTGVANAYGVEVVRREELVWERYERYVADNFSAWIEKTYANELNTQSNYYAAGRLAQYVIEAGASGRYVGLQSISPDGAISQVSWEISGSGCFTSASRLYEPSPYVPPYKERRINDMLRIQRRANKDNRKGRP